MKVERLLWLLLGFFTASAIITANNLFLYLTTTVFANIISIKLKIGDIFYVRFNPELRDVLRDYYFVGLALFLIISTVFLNPRKEVMQLSYGTLIFALTSGLITRLNFPLKKISDIRKLTHYLKETKYKISSIFAWHLSQLSTTAILLYTLYNQINYLAILTLLFWIISNSIRNFIESSGINFSTDRSNLIKTLQVYGYSRLAFFLTSTSWLLNLIYTNYSSKAFFTFSLLVVSNVVILVWNILPYYRGNDEVETHLEILDYLRTQGPASLSQIGSAVSTDREKIEKIIIKYQKTPKAYVVENNDKYSLSDYAENNWLFK